MDKSFTIQNAKKITEGIGTDNPKVTYLNSISRHDCKSHKLSNGDTVMVDGGNSFADGGYYGRGTFFTTPEGTSVENYSLQENSSFEEICDKLLINQNGLRYFSKDVEGPIAELPLKKIVELLDLSNTHVPLQKVVLYYWKTKKEEDLF